MSLRRNISLSSGLSYRGGWPYAAYIMHRIGGSALFIFFTLYILSLLGLDFAGALFGNWAIQIILLVLGLFHAINGLRITIIDLFPKLLVHQREAIWVEWAVFIPLFVISVYVIISTAGG